MDFAIFQTVTILEFCAFCEWEENFQFAMLQKKIALPYYDVSMNIHEKNTEKINLQVPTNGQKKILREEENTTQILRTMFPVQQGITSLDFRYCKYYLTISLSYSF